jgi:hypothetical protein
MSTLHGRQNGFKNPKSGTNPNNRVYSLGKNGAKKVSGISAKAHNLKTYRHSEDPIEDEPSFKSQVEAPKLDDLNLEAGPSGIIGNAKAMIDDAKERAQDLISQIVPKAKNALLQFQTEATERLSHSEIVKSLIVRGNNLADRYPKIASVVINRVESVRAKVKDFSAKL